MDYKLETLVFHGLTHSAFGLKGLFGLGLLCFGQRLTQTKTPSSTSKTQPQTSVNVSVKPNTIISETKSSVTTT